MIKSRIHKDDFDGQLVFGGASFHKKTNRIGRKQDNRPADGGLTRQHSTIVEEKLTGTYQRVGDFWEDVENCPICGSVKSEPYIKRLGLEFLRCSNCSHGYQSPRITQEKAIELYSNDHISADIYLSDAQISVDRKKYLYGLQCINDVETPNQKKILDLGCGSGLFVKLAAENNWEYCVGVDANSLYSDQYSDNTGVQFLNTSFDELRASDLGANYDCITMWNVLEHIYDVRKSVKELKALLRPDGLVFIMVPNSKSLATQTIRALSPTFNWKHVSHFTPESLDKLFSDSGFEKCFMETAISEIINIKSYMSGYYPYYGYGDPEGIFDAITPEFLHKNLLGSRLIGIYRNVP
jgi:2-polyprenyl-3-methyl-5-hydroxy-6-metoxy-1,4-benzoquinol methylase